LNFRLSVSAYGLLAFPFFRHNQSPVFFCGSSFRLLFLSVSTQALLVCLQNLSEDYRFPAPTQSSSRKICCHNIRSPSLSLFFLLPHPAPAYDLLPPSIYFKSPLSPPQHSFPDGLRLRFILTPPTHVDARFLGTRSPQARAFVNSLFS